MSKCDTKIVNSSFKFFEINPDGQYKSDNVMLLAQEFMNGEKTIPEAKYIILDNGVAEGAQLSNSELIDVIMRVKPNEIILPDVLKKKDETIAKTLKFYYELPNSITRAVSKMVVIQGETIDEFKKCAEMLAKVDFNVFGIPKHMVYTLGDMFIRVKMAKWLNDTYPDKDIHLLGMNEPFYIIKEAVNSGIRIRSCDSIVPYIYEKEGSTIPFDYYIRDTGKSFNEVKIAK